MIKNISKEELEKIIQESETLAHALRTLKVIDNSYNRNVFKNLCLKYNLSIDSLKKKLTREEYDLNPKFCKNCGKKIPFEKRDNDFCNSSCATSFNNKISKKKKHNSGFCLNCGKSIDKHYKFCGNTCFAEYKRKEYIKKWKNEEVSGTIGKDDIATAVKLYLREKYNNSCQCCGWNQVNKFTGIIPLQIHHIDGDCTNNKEENLQLLCPNCHALTENFGSRNTNCTRIDKRIR